MAYKFQVGPARLSGSTVFEEALSAASVTSVGASSAATLSASAGVSGASVSADGNGSFGDLTVGTDKFIVNNIGVITLGGAADTDVDIAADSFYFRDTDGSLKRDTLADYATAIAGDGLAASAGSLAVGVDDSSIEINADALRVKALGITNAMLADDAVGADELAANAVVNGSVVDGALKADKLDLDGSTDIGADLADADLLIVDDGAGGTNRVAALSRMKKYVYSAMSGDATASDAGALTIAADSVEGTMLNTNSADGTTMELSSDSLSVLKVPNALSQGDGIAAFSYDGSGALTVALSASVGGAGLGYSSGVLSLDIDELSALGSAAVHQTEDHFAFSDNGTEKKITFSNLQDAVFADVSGDATIAAGGALTIGAAAVEHGMLAEDIISGQAALGGASVAQADLLMLDDGPGAVKKVTFSNFEDSIFGNVSGDATVAAGGALTIAADAVEGSMLNDNVISGQTELAAGDIADADELMISDGGTLKKVGVDSLATFIRGMSVTAIGDANGDLAEGLNYGNAPITANRDWVLPDAPAVGDQVIVKAPEVGSGVSITVKVDVSTSHKIDGITLTSVSLEEDGAAATLVYAAANLWLLV